MALEDRKQREIEHSDHRRQIVTGFEYLSDSENAAQARIVAPAKFEQHFSNAKFYAIAQSSFAWRDEILRRRCPGKICLDYCCGNGEVALLMAKMGARKAYGIDLSPVAVENAGRLALDAGVGDRTHYAVMDAEQMQFPDNTFDVIHVYGALHHLELKSALAELSRVLKPDGIIVCTEALRHNPAIHWYRRRTPHLRTEWEVEHILGVPDIRTASAWFGAVRVRFFHLFTLLAVPFRKIIFFRQLLWLLDWADAVVLRIPGLRWMAWQAVFTLEKPRKWK
ncbi:MAG: class I SAM-dependent methyltransferase [Elusimicrobia bacterium]|nr:class I SAM-dependent methyltransferase [Elusimicrobiota bacterium]